MATLSDTSADVEARQFARLRSMTVAERGALMDALCADVTELTLAGIRMRYPDAPAEVVHRELLVRRYGAAFVDSLNDDVG